ncbi:hypothetical protein AJ79_08663 [Helicocarpus griseus UAMH5409]|uniref:STEEP1 domain-containing protein n=1 Tax=Helicocarpus griseus UAMH5409 TaxID=1447875 RepID=A0A2B7WRR8_9EURO|nr:hypothetical protein AJ79_08663 [Helicocarpus griseus UAMH5409]
MATATQSTPSQSATPSQPASLSQSQSHSPTPTADNPTRLPIKTYHCNFCNHLLLVSTTDLARLPRRREPARDRALILPLPKAKGDEDDEEEEEEEDNEGDEAGPEAAEVEGGKQEGADSNNNDAQRDAGGKVGDGEGGGAKGRTKSQQQQHYTILLSTTTPDRQPTMIRREDGFEKRLLLRCGRCRVVVGYALDEVHFGEGKGGAAGKEGGGGKEGGDGDGIEDREEREREKRRKRAEEVVYILPGALAETGEMGKEEGRGQREEWMSWEKKR